MDHTISTVFENSFCSVTGNFKCDVLVKYDEEIPPGRGVVSRNSGCILVE